MDQFWSVLGRVGMKTSKWNLTVEQELPLPPPSPTGNFSSPCLIVPHPHVTHTSPHLTSTSPSPPSHHTPTSPPPYLTSPHLTSPHHTSPHLTSTSPNWLLILISRPSPRSRAPLPWRWPGSEQEVGSPDRKHLRWYITATHRQTQRVTDRMPGGWTVLVCVVLWGSWGGVRQLSVNVRRVLI